MEIRKAIEGLQIGVTTSAQDTATAKLRVLHRQVIETLPRTSKQEIRVLYATLEPCDRTPYHSHRFPVTVYVTEGEFTLELDGQAPVGIKAGEVFVEPPRVRMTGRNLNTDMRASMVLFYACEPDVPFADPAD